MAIKIDGTSAIDKAILRRPRKSWLNTRAAAVGAGRADYFTCSVAYFMD